MALILHCFFSNLAFLIAIQMAKEDIKRMKARRLESGISKYRMKEIEKIIQKDNEQVSN